MSASPIPIAIVPWVCIQSRVRTIRLSERIQGMPAWVVDYVIVHELAHLLEPGHDEAFWGWVDHYPHAERAKGYLLGWSAASRIDPPPGGEVD